MSFATAVAHVPAICGLLGLSFAPMVYMILGSVPQMIVGPEAAVSMIVGQAIEKLTRHNDEIDPVDLLVVLTSCSGAILFAFGLMRFGFIDNVLCGSLLKGFVTAIGLTMMIGSTMAILGLDVILKHLPPDQHVHTPFDKICFIVDHLNQYNGFSTCIGLGAFVVLMFAKRIKKLFVEHKFKKASFFPEILIVVVVATVLSYVFDLEGHGLSVVGKIDTAGFRYKFPLSKDLRPLYGEVFGVAFMCAILGFFESSTAAKSLSSNLEIPVSSNRELIALGSIGLVIGSFGTLSSFGGYARSKLNSINGAKTPAAGMFMGLTTLFVTYYLTEYLYYLPNCVLQAVIATVGISLIQETPKDVMFHIRTRGYNELFTFVVTLTASIFFSIEIGVALGCFYSVMRVIKHSTGSRIQILCRVAGKDTFVNSEAFEMFGEDGDLKKKPVREFEVEGYKEFRSEARHHHDQLPEGQEWPLIENESEEDELNNIINNGNGNGNDNNVNGEGEGKDKNLRGYSMVTNPYPFPRLEDREGCLIVKIPEPLTFTNTSDLKGRLKRIELYGSVNSHPATSTSPSNNTNTNIMANNETNALLDQSQQLQQPQTRQIRHIVFDLHGMTSLDSSAAQILLEIIANYQKRAINVFFCRVYFKREIYQRLHDSGIEQLLKLCEGKQFGLRQRVPPYYDEILDALRVVDCIESSCFLGDDEEGHGRVGGDVEADNRSYFSDFVYDGLS
ncbi:unnamed protein product [Ambrosiozyma monospora]|uniref:Unnamed protein product n=1 Tax=Ambrosiozyma monospora TaxID=43982 RepID=A0A9W6YWK6_AMBMO|nr:unnamed protein product [Ambrosiozyma monospora]